VWDLGELQDRTSVKKIAPDDNTIIAVQQAWSRSIK